MERERARTNYTLQQKPQTMNCKDMESNQLHSKWRTIGKMQTCDGPNQFYIQCQNLVT